MQPRPRPWMKGKGPRYKRNSTQLNCLTAVIAMKARQAHQDEAASFDTDSKAFRIDNCASYCISNDKKDFITPLKRVNKKLKGLGGTLTEIYSGTIKWSIEDDTGVPHDIVIPHGLYVKDSPSKLLFHSIGPRLPKTSSLCQEAHGVQHTMTAFNYTGPKDSTPKQ
ncbi:hypothetical protein MHU86_13764 [Fragilaria crotonensis]|nr:hypothetical protein MHU86_13764 [Fragilaria crotonensis]